MSLSKGMETSSGSGCARSSAGIARQLSVTVADITFTIAVSDMDVPACPQERTLCAMLLLVTPQREERSIVFGDRVTFLLRGQQNRSQKRRPPRLALAGLLSGKSVSRGRVFRQGRPAQIASQT
ncbi:hypothetical protein ACFCQI_03795 [Rhodanobacter sp. FW102-FHT14D06]|uniref:Uncharacterized protein n=2 Tax=unclassified Rhodanobacter TaxID=2621553 RepID=A0AB74UVM1_9GAMM